jgi:ankyrin repeat protein
MKKTARTAFVFICLFMAFTIGYSQEPLVSLTIDQAAAKGDLATVKRELQKGEDVNGAHAGTSLLSLATKNGRLDMVKFLVDKGANLNYGSVNGTTPLMLAATNGHLDVVKFLVDKGADVNAKDHKGGTPLMAAVCEGNLDMVKFLVEKGAEVNARGNDGETPLTLATKQDVVEFLKQNGAK